jgi:hypothetical protein
LPHHQRHLRALPHRHLGPAEHPIPCSISGQAVRPRCRPEYGGHASSHDCRVNCGLRSADRRGRRTGALGECSVPGRATDRQPLPARKLVDDYAQFARTCQDSVSGIVGACGPKSPDSHRVVWGLTSRPPVSPAGFPPVSRLPAGSLPFVRLLLVSLRPAFSGLFPSAVARVPVPLRFPFGFPSLEQSSR